MRPRVGVTCRYQVNLRANLEVPEISLDARFADLIYAAGGLPLLIPPAQDGEGLREFVDLLDAVILSGGPDISPARYGAEPHRTTTLMHPRREFTDFHVLELAEARGLPLLAVCAGLQEWNVHRGGTLYRHLPDLKLEPHVTHRNGQAFAFHPVRLARDSLIHSIVEADPLPVNSSHHQGIDRIGRDLVPVAWSPDGLIEAVQDPSRPFALGIQWHPEDMPEDPLQRRFFKALVSAAER